MLRHVVNIRTAEICSIHLILAPLLVSLHTNRLCTPSLVFLVHPEFIRFGRELGQVPEQSVLSAPLQLLVTRKIFWRSFIIIKSKAWYTELGGLYDDFYWCKANSPGVCKWGIGAPLCCCFERESARGWSAVCVEGPWGWYQVAVASYSFIRTAYWLYSLFRKTYREYFKLFATILWSEFMGLTP